MICVADDIKLDIHLQLSHTLCYAQRLAQCNDHLNYLNLFITLQQSSSLYKMSATKVSSLFSEEVDKDIASKAIEEENNLNIDTKTGKQGKL